MAQNAGLNNEQIARLSQDALGEAIQTINSYRAAQPPAPPPAPEPEPVFDLGLTEEQQEEFGPELMAVLNKLGSQTAKELRDVKKELATYKQREVQRTEAQLYRSIDDAIGGLDPAYHAVIGGRNVDEVLKTDPRAFARREFVLKALQQEGLNFWTASPAEIRDRIKAQVDAEWGPRQPVPAGNQTPPVVTREQWNQAGSPPPTHRRVQNDLPPREGDSIEDRYNGALTAAEVEDAKINNFFGRRTKARLGQTVS